jgi:hypothetical protein
MRVYKLYAAPLGSQNAVSSLRVSGDGTITCIKSSCGATGGAGVGRLDVELSLSNVSSQVVNDTPGNVLYACNLSVGNALTASDNDSLAGLDIPIRALDTLYLNTLGAGTALASSQISVFVYVEEKKGK